MQVSRRQSLWRRAPGRPFSRAQDLGASDRGAEQRVHFWNCFRLGFIWEKLSKKGLNSKKFGHGGLFCFVPLALTAEEGSVGMCSAPDRCAGCTLPHPSCVCRVRVRNYISSSWGYSDLGGILLQIPPAGTITRSEMPMFLAFWVTARGVSSSFPVYYYVPVYS